MLPTSMLHLDQNDDNVIAALADHPPTWIVSGNTIMKTSDLSWKINTATVGSTLMHRGVLLGTGTCDGATKMLVPDEVLSTWQRLDGACRGDQSNEQACKSRDAYNGIVVMAGFCWH